MKIKNIAVIIFSVLILAAIGIGIATAYYPYFYKGTGELDVVAVNRKIYNQPELADDLQVLNAIDNWAQRNNATIFLYPLGVNMPAGMGYCGYSDWADRNLGLESFSQEEGAYIVSDPDVYAAYVKDEIFLPGRAALKIVGTFERSKDYSFITGRDILYPMIASPTANGNYYTDGNDINSLVEIFESNGFDVLMTVQRNTWTAGEIIQKIITDAVNSSASAFGVLGLIFCYVYIVLSMYKDSEHRLWILHLFGMSKRKITCGIVLTCVASIIISMIAFIVLYRYGLDHMGHRDFIVVTQITLIVNTVLVTSANGIGLLRIMKHFGKRGG